MDRKIFGYMLENQIWFLYNRLGDDCQIFPDKVLDGCFNGFFRVYQLLKTWKLSVDKVINAMLITS